MKTIKAIRATKEVELGEIRRVDDKTAHNMVGNYWQYISKSEWKTATRKPQNEVVAENVEKKKNPKQMDGESTDVPFVKTRKKTK